MRSSSAALRAVALLEAAKGAAVLLAASGLLAFVHRDLHAAVAAWVAHFHLNPAAHAPGVLLDAIGHLGDARLVPLALGALAYAALRFVEAWGLYAGRAWAEWLAAASGALYVPFELSGLVVHPSALGAALLVLNLLVVGLMLGALRRRRAGVAAARDTPPSTRRTDPTR